MTPHEALNDISHELMQRHTDLVVNGWDVKSVRMLKEAIGKRQLIVRKALDDLEELNKEVVKRQETEDSLTQLVAKMTKEREQMKKSDDINENIFFLMMATSLILVSLIALFLMIFTTFS